MISRSGFFTPTPTVQIRSAEFQGFLVQISTTRKRLQPIPAPGARSAPRISRFRSPISVVPDGALSQLFGTSVGDVTNGTAIPTSGVNISKVRFVGRGPQPPGPCARSTIISRDPARFSPINRHVPAFRLHVYVHGSRLSGRHALDRASLLGARGRRTAASGSTADGFNTDTLDFDRQLLLELDNIAIDEDGDSTPTFPATRSGITASATRPSPPNRRTRKRCTAFRRKRRRSTRGIRQCTRAGSGSSATFARNDAGDDHDCTGAPPASTPRLWSTPAKRSSSERHVASRSRFRRPS